MENLHFHNVSIHRNVHKNRFINECARKKKTKIKEFEFYFVRCGRSYVLER